MSGSDWETVMWLFLLYGALKELALYLIMATILIAFAVPTYKLATKSNYKGAGILFFLVTVGLVQHDIAFGKRKRIWYVMYVFVTYFGIKTLLHSLSGDDTHVLLSIQMLISVFLLVVAGGYKLFTIYKLFKSFDMPTLLFFLHLIPIINYILFLYMSYSSNQQYMGIQSHFVEDDS